ncbi:MAG: ATP-binding protein [Candidatus Aminicenantes bacterium]|nr:ATP-binding protein [Candidatus Aminicenantes bacterium]
MTKVKCTICDDSGWEKTIKDGKESLRKCKCQKTSDLRIKCISSNVPNKFAGYMLRTFGEKDIDSTLKEVITKIKKFIDAYPVGKGIILHGGTGLGKTHLLSIMVTELHRKHPKLIIFYIDWNDFVSELTTGLSQYPRNYAAVDALIYKLKQADILLWDEFAATKPNQWVLDKIYNVINFRYNRQKTTIFATNYKDETSDGSDTLQDRIGDRIRSRIFEMAKSYYIKGLDQRLLD